MFNNILQYYFITNYFHGYLMYVMALPIIILKQLFLLQYRLFIKKKNMINQYIKVNGSYRIIIPIISSHFSFSNITKYISIVIVV